MGPRGSPSARVEARRPQVLAHEDVFAAKRAARARLGATTRLGDGAEPPSGCC